MVLTLSELNTKEWGRSDKWDVRFQTGQGPDGYTNWLPATNVSTPVFNISTFDWASGHRTFSIPKAIDYPNISMTLMDDDERTIKKFLREWSELMFPEEGGIAYLSTIIKTLEISQLSLQNEVVDSETYIVFPTDSVASVLSSSPEIISYPLSFKVVGKKTN